jgi:NADH-quinone oxidoreductase subunit H
MWAELLKIFLRSVIFIVISLTAFAYLTYLERRVLSWFQWRVGPNRVGPWGLFQPIADGLKTILKQEIVPRKADRALYFLAPIIALAAGFTMFALVPVGDGVWISNVAVAVLVFLGCSSLGAYGIILAGWSSQSRYPFIGSLRACAQVISYELTLGLAILVPVLIVGSLSVNDIANIYRSPYWNPLYLIVLAPATLLFFVAALAETGRVPFDLPEGESEIVAGYMTEYSSLKYAMFPMGEYLAMCAMSAIAVHMFLGGYLLPAIGGVDLTNWIGLLVRDPGAVWGPVDSLKLPPDFWAALSVSAKGLSTSITFTVKVCLLIFSFMWIRATYPRLRYDQLMRLGWKVMLPAGIGLVILTAVLLAVLPVPEAGAKLSEVSMYVAH